MKRNINITNQFVKESIPQTNQVDITNIHSLVNYSVDSIVCNVLEYIDENELESFMASIIEKIRDNGRLVIKFVNFKKVFIEHINQKTSGAEIFSRLINKKNILSLDKIINLLNIHGLMVLKVDQDNTQFSVLAQRTNQK